MEKVEFTEEERDTFLYITGMGLGLYLGAAQESDDKVRYDKARKIAAAISNKIMKAVGGEERY